MNVHVCVCVVCDVCAMCVMCVCVVYMYVCTRDGI